MNDDLTTAAESVEAIRNDRAVIHASVTPSGEIEAVGKATTGSYQDAGEAIAASVDADVSFSRATRTGRLYFSV